jgi:division protein CdvB (Snf7/Vps24/ESCRT-III family)
MTDDPESRVLRIRYDQIVKLSEEISQLKDIIARIQYTNLRRDMNIKNRTIAIDQLCKGEG